jgi:hypothetical protein
MAKLWLDTLDVSRVTGFSERDLNRILTLVKERQDGLRRSWDEYFA